MLTATDKHTAAFNALGQTFPKQMPRVSRIKDFYITSRAYSVHLFMKRSWRCYVKLNYFHTA